MREIGGVAEQPWARSWVGVTEIVPIDQIADVMPAWADRDVAVAPYFMALRNCQSAVSAHFWPSVRGIAHSPWPWKQEGQDEKTAYDLVCLLSSTVLEQGLARPWYHR